MGKRMWTGEEELFLRENSSDMTIKDLIDYFKGRRTDSSIRCKLDWMGLSYKKEDTYSHWHNGDKKRILSMANNMSVPEIESHLGGKYNRSQIYWLLKTNDVEIISARQVWTDDDTSFIYENIGQMSPKQLYCHFGGRYTYDQIYSKLKNVGVQIGRAGSVGIKQRWSDEDLEFLRNNAVHMTIREIMSYFGGRYLDFQIRNKLYVEDIEYKLSDRPLSVETSGIVGKTFDEIHGEDVARVKQRLSDTRAETIIPSQDTGIELAIQNLLTNLNVQFEKHRTLKSYGMTEKTNPRLLNHQADVVIPSAKLIIECDGDYWHCYPYGSVRDRMLDDIIKANNWKILRLWEHEINNDIEDCENRILQIIEV